MIKKLIFSLLLILPLLVNGQGDDVLATWDETGDTVNLSTGINATTLLAVGLTTPTGTGFRTSDWVTGNRVDAKTAGKYIGFEVTLESGSLDSTIFGTLEIRMSRDSSDANTFGPDTCFCLAATDNSNFLTNAMELPVPVGIIANATDFMFDASLVSQATITSDVTIYFRLYCHDAGATDKALVISNGLPNGDDVAIRLNGVTNLPIELAAFDAKKTDQGVMLSWRTASELNNDYMAVERSRDGQNFREIGRVAGQGTTVEAQEYNFLDRQPYSGVNYYRLKQVDFDGAFEYHRVAVVSTSEGNSLNVFPTLTASALNVRMDGYAEFAILNAAGQVMKRFSAVDFKNIDVSSLNAGVYFLQVDLGTTVETVRFVKK